MKNYATRERPGSHEMMAVAKLLVFLLSTKLETSKFFVNSMSCLEYLSYLDSILIISS